MPVTSSAKKALRTSLKKRERNYQRRSTVKSSLKAVQDAVASGDAAAIKAAASRAMSQVDRARKTGVMPANTANRRKASIAAMVRKGAAGEVAVAKPQKRAAKKSAAKKAASKKTVAKKKS